MFVSSHSGVTELLGTVEPALYPKMLPTGIASRAMHECFAEFHLRQPSKTIDPGGSYPISVEAMTRGKWGG
jgi:hypothetical protein